MVGGALAARIDELQGEGDYSTALRIIGENVLLSYFSLQPEALQQVLEAAIAAGADDEGTARSLLFLFPTRGGGRQGFQPPHSSAFPDRLSNLSVMARITEHRLRGHSHRTRALLDELDANLAGSPTLFSHNSGWGIMLPLQAGITAMLSGDFKRALRYFTVAQAQPAIAALSFLTRDAYVKSAIVHALFGCTEDARAALAHAARIERRESWVEPLIDTNVALVEAVLEVDDPTTALEKLDAIPLQYLGEMLPFYVIAVHRILARAGRYRDLMKRAIVLEQLPFPRVDGEGLTGSIFPLIRVAVNLARGDTDAAAIHLHDADPDYVGTRHALGQLELAAKRPHSAIKETNSLASAEWNGLRQIELWRYAILSSAFLQLGRTDDLDTALRAALADGLTLTDTSVFSRAALDYAARSIECWPVGEHDLAGEVSHTPAASAGLTSRELEILILLRDAGSTQHIATRLFLSVNTVKSHIKSIYRKLGVTSRASAVLRAEAEGLL